MTSLYLVLAQNVNANSSGFLDLFSTYANQILTLAFVIFFFGFCVFIHELGHFLAAKLCGLKVDAFAIGFRKIWEKRIGGVDYRIGWLPFGGYCEIPQVDSSDELPKDAAGNQLPHAKPLARIITAFAGPLFNILFGLALGCVIWAYGLPDTQAQMDRVVVQNIDPNSPEYSAGLRDEDTITHVNNEPFYGNWMQFAKKVMYHNGSITFNVIKPDGKEIQLSYTPAPNNDFVIAKNEGLAYPFFTAREPAVCYPIPDSPAARGGMLEHDEIIAISLKGGEKQRITDRMQVIKTLSFLGAKEPTKEVFVWVRRHNIELTEPLLIKAEQRKDLTLYNFEPAFEAVLLPQIRALAPDHAGLLKTDDLILKINGKNVTQFDLKQIHKQLVSTDTQRVLHLTILRDHKVLNIVGDAPALKNYAGEQKYEVTFQTVGRYYTANEIGYFKLTPELNKSFENYFGVDSKIVLNAIVQHLPEGNFTHEIARTFLPKIPYALGVSFAYIKYPTPFEQLEETVTMTAQTLQRLFNSKSNIHVKNMSGPLGIITVIHKVSQKSYFYALSVIVMITFSLGLLNLFPIPILDGGHIVLATGELITGKRVPAKILQPIMTTFAILLIGFMAYVTFFDGKRLLNDIVGDEPGSTQFEMVLISEKGQN